MKKAVPGPYKLDSLSDAHRFMGLPGPQHPLISLLHGGHTAITMPSGSHVLSFYKIAYKPKQTAKLKYGQHYYDFTEGGLLFAAPGQVVGSHATEAATLDCSQYTLLIHPDFLRHYPLAKKIKQYGFFSYSADEALHLSEEEKETIMAIFGMIEKELNSRIDDFSQDVMIAHIESLLNYANRFYKRQFITRKAVNNDLLAKLETLLEDYLHDDNLPSQGLPTVQYLSAQLHLSPSYLSDMLRSLVGQNAQQFIHEKLLEKAKELLSTTNLSVSEVAYQLGFEHSQSFSRFFKTKAQLSPLQFRQSFN